MNVRFALPIAALLAGLLGPSAARAAEAPPGATALLAAAVDPAAVLPGIPLDDLTPEQQQVLARWALSDFCACGCPHTVSECLRTHHACKHAARMVRLAAAVVGAPGATPEALRAYVRSYYASFDRRAVLDVKAFGPPLGKEDAPLGLVEFSDFTCPFCQQLRPALEAFVKAHPELRLYFKPFPLVQHQNAMEAAIAGEWGRDHGKLWAMHDALFEAGDHGLDALADAAEGAGGDPSDLREAVTSRRAEARVRASISEGVKAGVDGTPTLFLDGRRLALPALSPEWLQFTLEDELEWRKRKGWEKD
jgi:protein-disulfide isomerase